MDGAILSPALPVGKREIYFFPADGYRSHLDGLAEYTGKKTGVRSPNNPISKAQLLIQRGWGIAIHQDGRDAKLGAQCITGGKSTITDRIGLRNSLRLRAQTAVFWLPVGSGSPAVASRDHSTCPVRPRHRL
jgi:hypothetical protein